MPPCLSAPCPSLLSRSIKHFYVVTLESSSSITFLLYSSLQPLIFPLVISLFPHLCFSTESIISISQFVDRHLVDESPIGTCFFIVIFATGSSLIVVLGITASFRDLILYDPFLKVISLSGCFSRSRRCSVTSIFLACLNSHQLGTRSLHSLAMMYFVQNLYSMYCLWGLWMAAVSDKVTSCLFFIDKAL